MSTNRLDSRLVEASLRWRGDGTYCVSVLGYDEAAPWRPPFSEHLGPFYGLDRALGALESAVGRHAMRIGRGLTWVDARDDAGPRRTEPPLPL